MPQLSRIQQSCPSFPGCSGHAPAFHNPAVMLQLSRMSARLILNLICSPVTVISLLFNYPHHPCRTFAPSTYTDPARGRQLNWDLVADPQSAVSESLFPKHNKKNNKALGKSK